MAATQIVGVSKLSDCICIAAIEPEARASLAEILDTATIALDMPSDATPLGAAAPMS